MSTLALEQPIKLMEQGENLQAQKILMDMLAINPHNLPAWYWYVKAHEYAEERIDALNLCLKYNPENEQVKLTLDKLQEQTSKPVAPLHPIEESDANDGKQMSILSVVFSMIYLIFVAFFIYECKYAIFDLPWNKQSGFAILWPLIGTILILGSQWALICLVAPVIAIIARRQHSLTALIISRIGFLFAVLFVIPNILFSLQYYLQASNQMPQESGLMLTYILFSLIQSAALAGFFGFATGAGLGTIGIVVHDIVTYIQHRIQAYRSGENLL